MGMIPAWFCLVYLAIISWPGTPPQWHPVEIVGYKWYLDSGTLRNSGTLIGDASQPTLPTDSTGGAAGNTAPPRLAVPANPSARPNRAVFRYYVILRNMGDRTIREVLWSYEFLNPKTRELIARHLFATRAKIKPGRTSKLQGSSYGSPSMVADVRALQHAPGWEKAERVDILRIQFEDGTVWSRAQ